MMMHEWMMMERGRAWLCAVLVALAALVVWPAQDASATTVVEVSVPEHTAMSHLVVLVEVESQRTFRSDADGHVYTDTTLHIDRVLAGEAGSDTVVVRQWGGTLGEMTHVLPGDAAFTPGEQAVVFLADREPETGVMFLTALAQSKYDVVGINDEGELILTRDFSGLTFYDPTRNEPIYIPDVKPTTLGAMVEAIRLSPGVKGAN